MSRARRVELGPGSRNKDRQTHREKLLNCSVSELILLAEKQREELDRLKAVKAYHESETHALETSVANLSRFIFYVRDVIEMEGIDPLRHPLVSMPVKGANPDDEDDVAFACGPLLEVKRVDEAFMNEVGHLLSLRRHRRFWDEHDLSEEPVLDRLVTYIEERVPALLDGFLDTVSPYKGKKGAPSEDDL